MINSFGFIINESKEQNAVQCDTVYISRGGIGMKFQDKSWTRPRLTWLEVCVCSHTHVYTHECLGTYVHVYASMYIVRDWHWILPISPSSIISELLPPNEFIDH